MNSGPMEAVDAADGEEAVDGADGASKKRKGSEAERCRACALRLLARREHSLLELRRKLRVRKFDEALIEETLQALAQRGLQSDRRFAESAVRLSAERGRGPVYIRHYLEARGISKEETGSALVEYREQWPARAVAARIRKYGETPPQGPMEHRRQLQFLLRRGFNAEHAHRALGGRRGPGYGDGDGDGRDWEE